MPRNNATSSVLQAARCSNLALCPAGLRVWGGEISLLQQISGIVQQPGQRGAAPDPSP